MTSVSWNELRITRQLCDGIIKTGDGGDFPIHRVILSAFSRYFLAFFTNSLNNGNPEITELVIEDVPCNIISLIIEFAYTQNCEVTTDNVHALFVTADRFGCESLITYCTEFISKNVNSSNCISTLKFARNYFCRDLESKAWQVTCNRIEEVMYTSEFNYLTGEELRELLMADELNVQREEIVFEVISRWVKLDPIKRQEHLTTLLQCVRFGLVSIEYYTETIKPFEYNNKESLEFLNTVEALFESDDDCYYYRYCHFRPRIPNEIIFTFGGWSEGCPVDVIETYDVRSDCWYLTNIKDQRIRAYHGVVSLNNLIYVIGGFDGVEYFSTMHCLDPVTNTWSEKSCMHEIRCYVSCCVLGEEIYAVGGFNGRSRLNSAEKYNPALNQWTVIAPLKKLRSDASAAAIDSKVFVAGGFNGQEVMRSVEVYSPMTDQWEYVECMTVPRSGVSLIAHNHYLYALGGFDGVNRLRSVERFNPKYNKWMPVADMGCARSNMASVIIDNSIFVIGGFDGAKTVPYTEFYDNENDLWYGSSSMNINRSALAACVCRDLPNAKSYTFLGVAVDSFNESGGELMKVNL